MDSILLNQEGSLLNYTATEMVVNSGLAIILGLVLAAVYRHTHKGLSYSQSFTQTIVFVTLIVAIVMMVIGGSLARAFALVGALSIIRFRTVVKDTKDISFIFAALALGMASGTGNYVLAGIGTLFVSGLAMAFNALNFGAVYKSEFILRFAFKKAGSSDTYLSIIERASKQSNLLHMEPSADNELLRLTYDITLKEDISADDLTRDMGGLEGISEVVLIASKQDVDY